MNSSLRNTVYASLFAALIIVGGYITIPLPFSPVPLVLSDFFVVLAGLALGASGSAVSIGMFLLLGLLGLPVFAGGKAGLPVLFGPTGGYLIGYWCGGVIAGLVARRGQTHGLKDALAILLGYLLVFTGGVSWLALGVKMGWLKALTAGMLPFLPGSVVKAVAAWYLIRPLRKLIAHQDE